MLKIRLSRRGKKRQPTYRIVVADSESKRDGRYVELIGWYNPLTNPDTFRIDEGRALHWLSVGAQPTDAVRRLLVRQGTTERLPRVHQGETIDALVAEFEGRPAVEEAAEVVEEAVEETQSTFEKVVEAATDAVEAVAEKVEDAAEAVMEAVRGDEAEAEEAVEEAATDEADAETEDKE